MDTAELEAAKNELHGAELRGGFSWSKNVWAIFDNLHAAWRERDLYREQSSYWNAVWKEAIEWRDKNGDRAARAEADVKRLLSQCRSANKHYDRLEDEVKILRTVREAAEVVCKDIETGKLLSPNAVWPEVRTLRRTLDAAQDPARWEGGM